jgi:hypothetical protein
MTKSPQLVYQKTTLSAHPTIWTYEGLSKNYSKFNLKRVVEIRLDPRLENSRNDIGRCVGSCHSFDSLLHS